MISQQLQQQQQQQQHQQQQPFNQNFQAESVEPDDVPAQHGNIQPGLVPTEADAGSSEKPMSVVSSQNYFNKAPSHRHNGTKSET